MSNLRTHESSFKQSFVVESGNTGASGSSREDLLSPNFVNNSYNNFSSPRPSLSRSFISSSLVRDSMAYGDDLRKSRIQNLPNYKKTNLGDNLQFIVIFQAIEIERLSNQVETLKVTLKETERQRFNLQNYEVQIRELTEKCFQLESERESYHQQITKLGKVCEQLYHENETYKKKLEEHDFTLKQKYESEKQRNEELMFEIEKWKNRYQATEKSKTKELEDLRNLMDSQRKSMVDRQIRQMTIKFQNERSMLENEIRKAREYLENRNREIEDYRQKMQKYEILLSELKNYENIISDNENKLVLLNQEFLHLNEVLKQKEQEIHEHRQRDHKNSQLLKEQQQWEYENKQLKSALEKRVQEIEDWKVRNSRNEAEVLKSKELEHYNHELSNKLQVTGREIERLNHILREKLDEIEQWKKRLQDKEMQLDKLKNTKDELANYESKFGMMQAENDRFSGLLKQAKEEIENWKSRNNNLQQTINDFSAVKNQKANLEEQYNKSIKKNQELQFAIRQLENDKQNLKEYENRYQETERKSANLLKEIERLNGVIRNHTNQMSEYQIRFNKMESTINNYKNYDMQVKDLENKIALLVTEKEGINNLVKTRNQQIQALEREKLEMHTKINHYKNYEIKISENEELMRRLNEQIANMKRDGDDWQHKCRAMQQKYKNMENQRFGERQEREKLNNILRQKTNDYENLKTKANDMEANCRKMSEIEMVAKEQHNQIMNHVSDLQRAQAKIQSLEQLVEKQGTISNQLACKVIVLSCEVERILGGGSQSAGIKSREYQQLKENYSRLQSKVTSKNNEIDILMTKIQSLEGQIGRLAEQFRNLLAQVEASEQESRKMQHLIEEYQDYAKRIHILGAEIDRLTAENRAYEDDAKKIRLKFADGLAVEKKQQDFNLVTVLMALEIENLRSRLDQREISMNEMRKSILEPVRKV